MEEKDLLRLLNLDIKGVKKIIAKNLNMKPNDIKIRYNKGVFTIQDNNPFITLEEVKCFNRNEGNLCKSIFYGLPIINSLVSYDRPIGGDVCMETKLFAKFKEPKYSKNRSSRYKKFNPVGYLDITEKNNKWRKGHILFAWLVDRFFYKTKFLPFEKKMMYFTQSIYSNEPVVSSGELENHFSYEKKLLDLLKEDNIEFKKFRYSVRLIYRDEVEKVPIATLLQLVTDSDNPEHRFNVFAPNIIFNKN